MHSDDYSFKKEPVFYLEVPNFLILVIVITSIKWSSNNDMGPNAWKSFVFLFIVWQTTTTVGGLGITAPDEILALQDIYTAAGGEDWRWRPAAKGIQWNFGTGSDPCADGWQGISCEPTGAVSNIVRIQLALYNMTGTLPNSIGSFKNLQLLKMDNNHLRGGFPTEICDLTSVTSLQLFENSLTGPIPTAIGSMQALTELSLRDNQLSGCLPAQVGELTKLVRIYLHFNELSCGIPSAIGYLTDLEEFYANTNMLTSSIPSEIGKCTKLFEIYIHQNLFTSALPDMRNLQNLETLYLYLNSFTGVIPPHIGNMTALEILLLDDNCISGSLPVSIGDTQLTYFGATNNFISGSLPDTIGKLSNSLAYLNLLSNEFTGTIPSVLGDLSLLTIISLMENSFTGTLPSNLGVNFNQLIFFYCGDTSITGRFPQSLLMMENAVDVKVSNNRLTGELPTISANNYSNSVLHSLDLSGNAFTGSIPPMDYLLTVEKLLLDNNAFDKGINSRFVNASAQNLLSVIDLSANRITGSLPHTIFSLPQLRTLALVGNCISGTFPESVCSVVNLETLACDGMSTACAVQHSGLLTGVTSSHLTLPDTLMECMLQLPTLQVLHFSGNDLSGTLPDISISSSMVEFDLSHNKYHGTIPIVYQKFQWDTFDVSYNWLGGTLSSDFKVTSNMTLSLLHNYLSGNIPTAFDEVRDIDVLIGNLFACDMFYTSDGEALPPHDEHVKIYTCGSNSVDFPLCLWILLGLVLLCGGCILWDVVHKLARYETSSAKLNMKHKLNTPLLLDQEAVQENEEEDGGGVTLSSQQSYPVGLTNMHGGHDDDVILIMGEEGEVRYVQTSINMWCMWYNMLTVNNSHEAKQLQDMMGNIQVYSICILCLGIIVLLPTHTLLSLHYGTYDYEYGWTVSAAYSRGTVPGVVVIAIWAAVVSMLFADRYVHAFKTKGNERCQNMKTIDISLPASTANMYLSPSSSLRSSLALYSEWWTYSRLLKVAFFLAVVFNAIVVIGMNIGYVFLSLSPSSSDSRFMAIYGQATFAALKMIWNSLCVPRIVTVMYSLVTGFSSVEGAQSSGEQNSLSSTTLLVFLAMFNNIAAPCIAVLALSSHCFYDLIIPPDAVNVTYTYQACISYLDDAGTLSCSQYGLAKKENSYDPPYVYSQQCTSDIITQYVPIFVFMFIFQGFVIPVIQMIGIIVHPHNIMTRHLCPLCDTCLRQDDSAKCRDTSDGPTHRTFVQCFHSVLAGMFTIGGFFASRLSKAVRYTLSKDLHKNNQIHNLGTNTHKFVSISVLSSNDEEPFPEKQEEEKGEEFLPQPIAGALFRADVFCATMMTNCVIVLTFGAMFPPVAVCGCIGTLVVLGLTKVDIGRSLHQLSTSHRHKTLVKLLLKECGAVRSLMNKTSWIVLPFAAAFYAALITEMFGFSHYADWMILLVVVVGVVPCGMWLVVSHSYKCLT